MQHFTLLHSEKPKLFTILAFLSAIGLCDKKDTFQPFPFTLRTLKTLTCCKSTQVTCKFGEFISLAEVALVCLKFKFHNILFTGYQVMVNLSILNQTKSSKPCTTDTL